MSHRHFDYNPLSPNSQLTENLQSNVENTVKLLEKARDALQIEKGLTLELKDKMKNERISHAQMVTKLMEELQNRSKKIMELSRDTSKKMKKKRKKEKKARSLEPRGVKKQKIKKVKRGENVFSFF